MYFSNRKPVDAVLYSNNGTIGYMTRYGAYASFNGLTLARQLLLDVAVYGNPHWNQGFLNWAEAQFDAYTDEHLGIDPPAVTFREWLKQRYPER